MTPILRSCKICDSLTWRLGLELELEPELEPSSLFEDECTKADSDWSDKSYTLFAKLRYHLLCALWTFFDMVSLCSDYCPVVEKFFKGIRTHVACLWPICNDKHVAQMS